MKKITLPISPEDSFSITTMAKATLLKVQSWVYGNDHFVVFPNLKLFQPRSETQREQQDHPIDFQIALQRYLDIDKPRRSFLFEEGG